MLFSSSRRGQVRRRGSERCASSGPAMSSQCVTMSVAAKPWRLNACPIAELTKSASGEASFVFFGGDAAIGIAREAYVRDAADYEPQQSCRQSAGSGGNARSEGASRLVRPPPPRSPVAGEGGRGGGPLSRMALGNHAAANAGRNRRALLRKISREISRRREARESAARRRAEGLGGARLLRAGAQPACLRACGRQRARRKIPRYRGRAA